MNTAPPPNPAPRRRLLAAAGAAALLGSGVPLRATAHAANTRLPAVRPRRLQPGDTVALVSPASATFERAPIAIAIESLQTLGFKVREAPHLRARYGHFAGTEAQRAADINAMFADSGVHGILALTGGSGGHRLLPRIDFELVRRNPKFLGGFSDITALLNAVNTRTGLVSFHAPVGISEWNQFSVDNFRAVVMQAEALLMRNPIEKEDALVAKAGRSITITPGRGRGPLVGGNLTVLSALSGSAYWPDFRGAILVLEDINEYIYRVDRMLGTLKLAGALDGLAGVVLGGFTNCGPGEGYGSLTLDEVFDDYFKNLGVPVFSGASFGHIRKKWTLPLGAEAEIDADAGTLRLLQPAVL
jgi:muramoyltetrapeptide carboxypeptidase